MKKFKFEVVPFEHGIALFVNGVFSGSFCSPFTLFFELVSNFLPRYLGLYK